MENLYEGSAGEQHKNYTNERMDNAIWKSTYRKVPACR